MAVKERNTRNGAVSKRRSSARAPSAAAPRAVDGAGPPDEAHGPELDRYDIAILGELQREARLSNAELASRIGLSAAPTWRRVKWLERQRYITGYRAELDRRRVGLGVLAFVRVDAERNNASATRALEEAIRALPEVVACQLHQRRRHLRAARGGRTDLDAYSRWARDTLFKLPNVKDIHTSFSLGEVKSGAALPLSHLRA